MLLTSGGKQGLSGVLSPRNQGGVRIAARVALPIPPVEGGERVAGFGDSTRLKPRSALWLRFFQRLATIPKADVV